MPRDTVIDTMRNIEDYLVDLGGWRRGFQKQKQKNDREVSPLCSSRVLVKVKGKGGEESATNQREKKPPSLMLSSTICSEVKDLPCQTKKA